MDQKVSKKNPLNPFRALQTKEREEEKLWSLLRQVEKQRKQVAGEVQLDCKGCFLSVAWKFVFTETRLVKVDANTSELRDFWYCPHCGEEHDVPEEMEAYLSQSLGPMKLAVKK